MIVSGDASFTSRRYVNALAGDLLGQALPGDPLRADTLRRAGAGWSFPLFPAKTGPFTVSLHVEYSFVRHRSNDSRVLAARSGGRQPAPAAGQTAPNRVGGGGRVDRSALRA